MELTLMELTLSQVLFESDFRLWHVSWSSDGSLLAVCGTDKKCRIWQVNPDATTFSLLTILGEDEGNDEPGHSRTIRSCSFSSCHPFLLCTASFDATCRIWQQQGNKFKMQAVLEGHENEVKSASWSRTGKYLVTGGRDKTCWVWERVGSENGDINEDDDEWSCVSVLTGHEADVKYVQFHPTSESLVFSCSYDNTIRVWEFQEEGEGDFVCIQVLQHPQTIWGMCFLRSKEDKFICCSQDGSLQTYGRNESSGLYEPLFRLEAAHDRPIFSVQTVSNSRQLVLTASGDNAIGIWRVNPESGFISAVKLISQAHDQDVNCIAVRPSGNNPEEESDGALVASVGDDGTVKIWNLTV